METTKPFEISKHDVLRAWELVGRDTEIGWWGKEIGHPVCNG